MYSFVVFIWKGARPFRSCLDEMYVSGKDKYNCNCNLGVAFCLALFLLYSFFPIIWLD